MADSDPQVDFGYEKVAGGDKAARVRAVFASVAGKYDLMNDLMSFGAHRLWKHFTLSLTGLRAGQRALDVAGGTGDLAAGLLRQVGKSGWVVLSDINPAMLEIGRDRLLDLGFVGNVECIVADAERLPFEDNAFDCVTIGFGLRNVTDKAAALRSMYRVLKPGGQLLVLEFSTPVAPGLKPIYDAYSFKVLPLLGGLDGKGRGQLSLSRGIDPHAPEPGNPARDVAYRGLHPGALPQFDRWHRRRASRLQDLTCPRLPHGWHRLEALLNRSIDASARAAALARPWRALLCRSTSMASPAFARAASAAGWRCSRATIPPADAVISGSVPRAAANVQGRDAGRQARTAVQIRGDAEIANRYRDLFAAARPDLEEELSRWVGDMPARQVSIRVARGAGLGTPRPAHGRREHRRVFAGGRPRFGYKTEMEEFLRGVDGCGNAPIGSRRGWGGSKRRVQELRLMRPRVLARLLKIQRALVRHGLDEFVRATHLYRPLRYLFYVSPWTWFQRSVGVTRGERLRLALEELGPIFVKFGQALSTRRDLLPVDIADELAKLQDRVPPFPGAVAMA